MFFTQKMRPYLSIFFLLPGIPEPKSILIWKTYNILCKEVGRVELFDLNAFISHTRDDKLFGETPIEKANCSIDIICLFKMITIFNLPKCIQSTIWWVKLLSGISIAFSRVIFRTLLGDFCGKLTKYLFQVH